MKFGLRAFPDALFVMGEHMELKTINPSQMLTFFGGRHDRAKSANGLARARSS
jgi:hypothetical protein